VFRLDGKTALVTGASQGIGAAVARALARQGARVVLAARSEEKLQALAEEIRAAGGQALAHVIDLADTTAIKARIEALPADWAEIDILVNNAGITADGLLARMSLDDWQKVLTTNLTGAYAMTKELVRGMMRRRSGRIISIGSVVGLMGNAGQANYAAAKAGLIGFSKSLARELATRGITVNVVAPGFIQTAMTDAMPQAARDAMTTTIPQGRLGTVDDIAPAVVYLASDEASYVTGQVVNVSGGLYI
jgi:3-oxoacyl-[acyl-carrier protein] reductase